jgi:hypothetical protein
LISTPTLILQTSWRTICNLSLDEPTHSPFYELGFACLFASSKLLVPGFCLH